MTGGTTTQSAYHCEQRAPPHSVPTTVNSGHHHTVCLPLWTEGIATQCAYHCEQRAPPHSVPTTVNRGHRHSLPNTEEGTTSLPKLQTEDTTTACQRLKRRHIVEGNTGKYLDGFEKWNSAHLSGNSIFTFLPHKCDGPTANVSDIPVHWAHLSEVCFIQVCFNSCNRCQAPYKCFLLLLLLLLS